MHRRQAVAALAAGSAFAAPAAAADDKGRVSVPTQTGWRELKGKEAEAYHATNAWLADRLKEAESIRLGSTSADVVKHFRTDGGVVASNTRRFVMVLCPYLKIDVEFEPVRDGVMPLTAKVTKVSRPYFEPEFLD